jgi:hypothetical protein
LPGAKTRLLTIGFDQSSSEIVIRCVNPLLGLCLLVLALCLIFRAKLVE